MQKINLKINVTHILQCKNYLNEEEEEKTFCI